MYFQPSGYAQKRTLCTVGRLKPPFVQHGLSWYQPLQLQSIGVSVRKAVLGLLDKPAFGAAAKTLESVTAISGDMPRFSFTSSESVVRVTPRAAAASVMLKPKGSMH